MIARDLHFMWIDGVAKMPSRYRKCVDTWREINPDCRVFIWTRDTLDPWVSRTWAFDLEHPTVQSDVLRFEIVQRHGGMYLDSDMQCLKPIDRLFELGAFTSMRTSSIFEIACFGAPAGHKWLDEVLREIDTAHELGRIAHGLDVDEPYRRATDRHAEVTRVPRDVLQCAPNEARGDALAAHHRFSSWIYGEGARQK